ncbi:ATP-binding protein [Streptomyces sp. NPDC085927]|uniref:ATP-binding protein n=1 Tax=Streptomyces sp. NPDC085927 TaxID=3365738 RepID=UPI0037D5F0EB
MAISGNARRIRAAGFPREKSLRTFGFEAHPNIDPATIHALAGCEWIKRGQPLCLIGDSGTGKSHLLIARCADGSWRNSGRRRAPPVHVGGAQ